MASKAARIALFDLGNVVFRWNPANLYNKMFATGAEASRFLSDIEWQVWHLRHDAGERFADTSAELIAQFPHYQSQIEAWYGRWPEMFDGPVPGVSEIVEELSEAGAPLYALTNMPAEVAAQTFAMFPAISKFRDIVVSGELRVVKPDPAIYLATLERIGAQADEIFFTDNSLPNIVAADALGFRTHHFEGATGLRAALKQTGLLRAAA